jgi:hypothetical protein
MIDQDSATGRGLGGCNDCCLLPRCLCFRSLAVGKRLSTHVPQHRQHDVHRQTEVEAVMEIGSILRQVDVPIAMELNKVRQADEQGRLDLSTFFYSSLAPRRHAITR